MIQFEYIAKHITKGDAISIVQNVKLNEIHSNQIITNRIISDLNKLNSVCYVHDRVGDLISILPKKGKGVKPVGVADETSATMFPVSLFKVVKVPKMNDVAIWLYDNQPIKYPLQYKPFLNEIKYITRYIIEVFQTSPQVMTIASKTCNRLYYNDDPLETLMFYKSLVQGFRLSFYDRYNQYNAQIKKNQFITMIKTLNKEWHTLDAISLWELNRRMILSGEYISNEDRLSFYKDPAKERAYNKKKNDDLKSEIAAAQSRMQENKLKNDSRFLTELNQDIIDDLELVIFNIKSLTNQNKILFIFIDKDNLKKYYLQDFVFKFYISNNHGIVNNDYIELLTENHLEYMINDFEILKKLKFAVNNNHKNFMKRGKF